MRLLHRDTLERLIVRALDRGCCTRVSGARFTVDYSNGCDTPVRRELYGAYDLEDHRRANQGRIGPLIVNLHVRCRQCPPCQRAKRSMWRERGKIEVMQSARTWFSGGMTFKPSVRTRAWAMCRVAYARGMTLRHYRKCLESGTAPTGSFDGAGDFDRLDEATQFKWLGAYAYHEATLWIKRLRKETAAPLRYLLVAEPHKDGFPHLHMLLHESSAAQPVRKKTLEGTWAVYGFSRWRLVKVGTHADMRAVGYVCKYITNQGKLRVRNSQNYGQLAASGHDVFYVQTEMFDPNEVRDSTTHKNSEKDDLRGSALFALEDRTDSEV